MANRMKRRSIAKETIEILERGSYVLENGETVDISQALQRSIAETKHFAPEDFEIVLATREKMLEETGENAATRFEVINTTTLAAARALIDEEASRRVVCLNFASAKNPGGGFLGGSQAQEESLARATGLYATINGVRGYYDTNRACGTCLYTDHMIYSPDVPVFRDDRDTLIDRPFGVSFITSPAVNAGALANSNPDKVSLIAPTMRKRIERVLSLAIAEGVRHIVLGAWGCGVFRNNPTDIAGWFYEQLCEEPKFRAAFDRVVFAVLDNTKTLGTIRPFEERFGAALKKI